MQVVVDGIVILLLYLIAAPALLLQLATGAVRAAWLGRLRSELLRGVGLPAAVGLGLLVLVLFIKDTFPLISRFPAIFSDVVLLVLFALAVFVTVRIFPVFSADTTIERLAQKLLAQAHSHKTLNGDDLKILARLGAEGSSGERTLALTALIELIKAVLNQTSYNGFQLGAVLPELHGLAMERAGNISPARLLSAAQALSAVSEAYAQHVKTKSDFADHDRVAACWTASQIGRAAVRSSQEVVTRACIHTLSASEPFRPEDLQGLCEIGRAAVTSDCMGAAASALQALQKAVTEAKPPIDQQLLYDYTGLLAAFWAHGESARAAVKPQIDHLKQITNLRQLIGDAVQHHCLAGQFTTADHIRQMWDGYLRIA